MAKATGFLEHNREEAPKQLVHQRIKSYKEFTDYLPFEILTQQAARCMDCGVPSCHTFGCPVENRIPDFNDLVYRNQWKQALQILQSTNNFPEFTGRVCPAPCETSCTLGINQPPVNIKQVELQIVERGFKEGWIHPEPSNYKTGKRVAVIGSGPAGLAAAQQLVRSGHKVVLMERDARIGGLLRYGIPDFKLEKSIIDRRAQQMAEEGVKFETEVEAGLDISARYLKRTYDAIVITAGATVARNLDVPGRDLDGVHFAMEFLGQQNRRISGEPSAAPEITAKGKHVIVVGGGDTGSDCVGTSIRQGAKSVTQIELLPKPPLSRPLNNPWPEWPNVMRTSSSHEEGCERRWGLLTKELKGDKRVSSLKGVELDWTLDENGKWQMNEKKGSSFELEADLVLLAMGFLHMEPGSLTRDWNLALDKRGNVIVDSNFMTSTAGVFAAGDAVMGASLVVRAIFQGRQAAAGVTRYLSSL